LIEIRLKGARSIGIDAARRLCFPARVEAAARAPQGEKLAFIGGSGRAQIDA
jgi:hypothetical protein